MKTFLLAASLSVIMIQQSKAQKPVINHVAMHVQNLERSRVFYAGVIGLDSIPEPFRDGNHAWFSMGSAQLHLIGNAKSNYLPSRHTHLCFSVKSVDEFILNLNKAGVVYEDVKGQPNAVTTRVDGIKQIYFKDPDGYWLEVNDAKN